MREASPFWFTAKAANGAVTLTSPASAATSAAVVASMRARKVEIIPSIADGSAARAMAAILKSTKARSAHVKQLVDLVVGNGFDGIELDYEKLRLLRWLLHLGHDPPGVGGLRQGAGRGPARQGQAAGPGRAADVQRCAQLHQWLLGL